MATEIRQRRVAGLLYEELSMLIGGELNDPLLTMAEVTEVEVSRDLRSARVWVHNRDPEVSKEATLARLRKATPFLRREIAARANLRAVPELHFRYDDTPARAARIDELLQQIAEERAAREANTVPEQPGQEADADAPH